MREWAPKEDINDYNRYDVGIRCFPGPEDKQVRDMLYLVAYDICENNRLRRIAKVCELYGNRVEKSVFECDLPPQRFAELWQRLLAELDAAEDALVAYPLDKGCAKRVQSAGTVYRPPPRLWYFL